MRPLISADLGPTYFFINAFPQLTIRPWITRNPGKRLFGTLFLYHYFFGSGGGPPDPPLRASCIHRMHGGWGGQRPLSKNPGSAPAKLY